ncbi:hypothetical protein BH10ACT1_BH10ACT1_42160 [soil metagenome]
MAQEVETTSVSTSAPAPGLTLFQGFHRLKLEATGRIALPSAYKGAFGPKAFIRAHRDQMLMLWTPEAFETVVAAARADDSGVLGPRRVKRLRISTSEVAVDKQGRFVVPAELKAHVGLGEQIVLAGAGEAIEIYSSEAFAIEAQSFDENDLFFDGYEGE